MGQVPYHCPHRQCRTKNTAFDLLASSNTNDVYGSVFGVCGECRKGVVFEVQALGLKLGEPHKYTGFIFRESWEITGVFPAPPEPTVIEQLPARVAEPFLEAEVAFDNKAMSAAAAMYRKAIERTLKDKAVEPGGNLNARIRRLEKANAVPDTLIKLLDTVRFLGNSALHDDEDPKYEEVAAGREFTILFLTYIYELPARVAKAQAMSMLE